jgi:hypothetical protein
MKKQALMMALFLGLAALPSLAHGGGPHLKGTVSANAADQITVKRLDGHDSQATVTSETRFMRGKAVGKREELHQGDRVVVHTRKKGDTLEAVEIHYGAAAKKAPQARAGDALLYARCNHRARRGARARSGSNTPLALAAASAAPVPMSAPTTTSLR